MTSAQIEYILVFAGNALPYVLVLALCIGIGLYFWLGRSRGAGASPIPKWQIYTLLGATALVSFKLIGDFVDYSQGYRDVVIQVFDGQPMADYPLVMMPEDLMSAAFVHQNIMNNKPDFVREFGKVQLTGGTIILGNKPVVRLYGATEKNVYFSQYIGVLKGRERIVQCRAVQINDDTACEKKAIEIFGQPSDKIKSS
jgi:hypothetical protein